MKTASKFVVLCWIITGLIWVISALSVKPTKERQPIFDRLLYLWLAVVVAMLLIGAIRRFDLSRAILPHTVGIAVLADLIVLLGFVIAVWARLVLGGNWSSRVVLKENHELIQRGPYHFVRHPIYSGLLLMVLGTVVLAGTLGAFVALLICSCAFWIKLRQEEALLTKRLPGYSEYKARTKALIPLVF